MEALLILIFSVIFLGKFYALWIKEDIKKSFIIASLMEFLYLSVGLLGLGALSVSILHIEYQVVFRILAYLMLIEFLAFKGVSKLSELKGVAFNIWGVVFGFAIFGSLGVALVASKQLMLNVLSEHGMFELGYFIVAIGILQAIYLITIFETVVFKNSEEVISKVKNLIPIVVFIFLGLLVFIYPKIYFEFAGLKNIDVSTITLSYDYYGIRGIFAFIFAFIMTMVFIYSLDYIKENRKFYYSFLAILTLALVEIPLSDKFEHFYLFWELMTISSYLLIMNSRSEKSISAAKIYFVMCIGGAYLLQLAFSQYYAVGIEAFSAIQTITMTIAVLMLLGFGVKAGIVPIHQWLPIAHPEAPSSISAPLSGILTKAGIFGIILVIYMFGFKNIYFSYLLITIGLVTLFYGEIRTLYEKDIKRLFAYSTIGQIGEIITVLGVMNSLALTGAIYHVINHAVVKDLLFLSAGILILSAKSRNLEDLKGIGKELPIVAFPLGVGIFAISGFPPFGNFNSKFLMIMAAMKENNYVVAFGLIIGALIGFIGMLRVFKYIFLYNPSKKFEKVGGIKLYAVYFLAFISFILGIFPKQIIDMINSAVSSSFVLNIQNIQFNLALPLSVVIMVIGAIVVFFFGEKAKTAGITAAFFSFLALLNTLTLPFNLGTFFADLTLFMAILNFSYAAKYMDHYHKPYRFFTNFMIMIIGILGVVLSKNIYSAFFYWEIMGGWALYIALVHEEDAYSIREASKYLIYNFAGAGILMIGFAYVMKYGWNFDVFKVLPLNDYGITAIVLLTIGFLAKAAQLPVRIDYQMHPKPAPTPISGYISSVMLKTGPFMLIKVFYLVAFSLAFLKLAQINSIAHFAAIVGTLTIIMGAAFGLMTNSMKRLLIFLTVGEIGYIITGISLLTSEGLAGGMLHLINHMFFKDLLFLSAGAIFYKTGVDSLDEIGGLAKKMPITFITFLVAIFSTAGVPLYSGFVSKWMIYHALIQKGYVFLAILTLLGSIMILLVFVKFLHSAYFGKLNKKFEHITEVSPYMYVPMVILAVMNIILGIFPSVALAPINAVIHQFGLKGISYTLTSVKVGVDVLDMSSLAVYLILAIVIGYFLITYFSKDRKTHIFLSGVRDLSERELHINARNFYEQLIVLISTIIRITKRIFGLKGGYVER